MPRPVTKVKTCPYGCRFFSDSWHAENCPGTRGPGPQAVFFVEPEYAREQQADERDRRHEAYEDQRLYYPERGLSDV